MKDKTLTILFWSSVVLLTIMSLTFMFMPMVVRMALSTFVPIKILGIIFWITCILGYACVIAMIVRKRKLGKDSKFEEQKKMGVFTIFSNPIAKVMDVMFVISLFAFIVMNFTSNNNVNFTFILLSILVFSLNMHCLFNGRIYKNL